MKYHNLLNYNIDNIYNYIDTISDKDLRQTLATTVDLALFLKEEHKNYSRELTSRLKSELSDLVINSNDAKLTHKINSIIDKYDVLKSNHENHRPALIVVFGFDQENSLHKYHATNGYRNIDGRRSYLTDKNIHDYSSDKMFEKALIRLARQDNALLLNNSGDIVGHGAYLDNLSVRSLVRDKNELNKHIWEALGFSVPVNARHLAAIEAAYRMKTMTMTLSEETGDIRIYDRDKGIVASTVDGECELKCNNIYDVFLDNIGYVSSARM